MDWDIGGSSPERSHGWSPERNRGWSPDRWSPDRGRSSPEWTRDGREHSPSLSPVRDQSLIRMGINPKGWSEEPSSTGLMSNEELHQLREYLSKIGDESAESHANLLPARYRDPGSSGRDLQQWSERLMSTSSLSNEELQQLRECLLNVGNESGGNRRGSGGYGGGNGGWESGYSREELDAARGELEERLRILEMGNQGEDEAQGEVWEHDGGHSGGNGGGDGGNRGVHDRSDEDNNNENIIPLSSETPVVGRLIIDPGRTLSPEERAFAEFLVQEGHVVIALAEGHTRTSDYLVDGVATELKTVSQITTKDVSGALGRILLHGAGQAAHVIADTRQQAEVTLEVAERAIRRAYGVDNKYATDNNVSPRLQQIRIIGKDFDITRPRV